MRRIWQSIRWAFVLALCVGAMPTFAAALVLNYNVIAPGQPTSRTPQPVTPVGNIINAFASYGAAVPFAQQPFHVTETGPYTITVASAPVSNGFYVARGLFVPDAVGVPTMPLGEFQVFRQNLTSTTIPAVNLVAGQQYTLLMIFGPGTAPVTLTIAGDPGNLGNIIAGVLPTPIPTLSQWSMLVLVVLIALTALGHWQYLSPRR